MRLTTKGRYAVMAMVDLASNSQGRPIALADIAERQDISLSYLEQLFANLRRAGLVMSVRGPGGGYKLSYDPADMRIADIALAVDEPTRANRCTPSAPMTSRAISPRTPSDDLWDELGLHIHRFLSAITVQDVVDRRVSGLSRRMLEPAHPTAAE
ncbi:MAG: Rrf2 family transcriptional regulator [Alphaproteobacteria bacterium]|nr:Rrf2 family transcriptional regulator [Alphaproteobacteria bacterium]